jgi:citrate lyase subunit beta/citryl-CoA lyase
MIVFDLEDGVAPDRKVAARETVVDALAIDTASEVCVRINPVGMGGGIDLAALAEAPSPDSLMLPKVSTPGEIETVSQLGAEYGIDCSVVAIIETAAGVLAAGEIAAVDRTDGLIFGAEDLAADLGATRTEEGMEVAYARQQVVLAARAHGVDAIDTHYPEIGDKEGLRQETEQARRLGYDGKMAMHPRQAEIINEAFRPSDEELAWARRVLEAVDEEGEGVISVDGEMIDAPQRRQAERIVDLAAAADTE